MTDRSRTDPPDLAARIEEGLSHHRAGRLAKAEAIYRRLLEQAPEQPDALFLLSAIAQQAGRHDEAVPLLRRAIASRPTAPEAHNNLGIALMEQGKLDEAVSALHHAIEIKPDNASAHNSLGNVLKRQGDLDGAVAALRSAIELEPGFAGGHSNLASVLLQQGKLGPALENCQRALDLEPKNPAAHNNMGNVLREQGRTDEAVAAYQRVIALAPKHAKAHNNLGHLLIQEGERETAIGHFRRAVEYAPAEEQFRADLRAAVGHVIPSWHFPMLGDRARNDAYRRAIEKAVDGTGTVLDIGAGSGLLAMMAARAGAGRVIACEMVEPLAEVAERIVAANGYADRIAIVAKKSTQLEVGRDLPAPADLLITEIFDYRLLGEGVLATLRHANANLLAADARVVPAAATVWGMLIECPELRSRHTLGAVSGFDLSEFDALRDPLVPQVFDMAREPHRALTAPFEVMRLDFRRPPGGEVSGAVSLEGIADGTGHAVAFWFDLELDDEIRLSTRTEDRLAHWRQGLQFLDADLPVRDRQPFELLVGHTETGFIFQTTPDRR